MLRYVSLSFPVEYLGKLSSMQKRVGEAKLLKRLCRFNGFRSYAIQQRSDVNPKQSSDEFNVSNADWKKTPSGLKFLICIVTAQSTFINDFL